MFSRNLSDKRNKNHVQLTSNWNICCIRKTTIFNRHGFGTRTKKLLLKSDLMNQIKETGRLNKYLAKFRYNHPYPPLAYCHIDNCSSHWKYFKNGD